MSDIIDYRGKWALVWRDAGGSRKRTSLGFDAIPENYEAAQRAAADLENVIAIPVTESISDIYAAYVAKRGEKVLHPAALTDAWKALAPFWGGLRVDQITRDRCEVYAAERYARGNGPGTVLKQLGLLRAAINWAGKTGAVFEFPSSPPARNRWLKEEEFMALLDASRQPHFTLWLHLAIATAGRKSAILELKWDEHIDFSEGTVKLGIKVNDQGRQGKARATVPMTNTLRAVLETAHAAKRGPYVVQYNGQRVENVRKAFDEAATRAGLKGVTPHDIRHTAAVWMVSKGVPLWKVSQYLGHGDSRITEKVYARFAPDHLKDAASALDLTMRPRLIVSNG